MRRTRSNWSSCLEVAVFFLFAAWLGVHANAVQIHTGPGNDYPVAGTVAAGQKLEVIGEEGAWVKVFAPSSVPAWIYSELLRGAVVSVPSAVVRVGPGIEHAVLIKLRLGTPLKILQTDGAWVRIGTPKQAAVWVGKDFLVRGRVVEPLPVPVRPPERPMKVLAPDRPLQAHPGVALRSARLPQGTSVELEGVVERVAFVWRSPGRYRLMADDGGHPRAIIAYLTGSDADLARVQGKRARVTGQQSAVTNVRYPVVQVGQVRDISPR